MSGRPLATYRQEVGDHAQHAAPRARLGLFEQGQHFADAGAEPFVIVLEPLQNFDPARQAAAFLPQNGKLLAGPITQLPQPIGLLAFLGLVLPKFCKTFLQMVVGRREFLQFQVQSRQAFRGLGGLVAQPIAFPGEIVNLGLAGDGVVLQARRERASVRDGRSCPRQFVFAVF